jgi:hypothetical protein
MGRQVTSDTADTTHVRALKIVAPDGAALGGNGITLISPDGTEGVVTLLDTDELALDGTAIGGGGGAAGLENGTGTSSLQSAASLTTTAANAGGNNAIALGNNARVPGGSDNIAIGNGAQVNATANNSQAFGENAAANSSDATAIGNGTDAGLGGTALGTFAQASGTYSTAIGKNANASATEAIAIGRLASATAAGATAIGRNVTATIADTVSVKALEVQTDSTPTAGGIIMSDAGGTDRRLNITTDGTLQVDSVPAAGQVFKLPRVGGLNQASGCDVIQSSVLIPGGTMQAGDIWQLSGADSASGSTGFVYSAFWISTTGTVGNSATEEVNIGQQESGSTQWSRGYQKNLYIGTQDGTGIGTELVCAGCSQDATLSESGGIVTYTPDWTNDLYLVARVCVDNAGATYVNHGATLRKIN